MQLDLDRLTQALSDSPVRHTLDYHYTLDSTMTRARELAALATTRSGTVVVAEEQTAGRGRQQRSWEAPLGSALLTTFLLRSPLPVELGQLPMWVGLVVLHSLETFVPALSGQIGLKWPNDLLLGTTPHSANKVAGILIETSASSPTDLTALVGIGINVNQTATELPTAQPGAPLPTSLRLYLHSQHRQGYGDKLAPAEAASLLDRTALLLQLCRNFGSWLENPPAPTALWGAWRSRLWTLNQWVTVREQAQPTAPGFVGRAVDVTPTGDLVVEDEQGTRRTFAAGDVTLRPA